MARKWMKRFEISFWLWLPATLKALLMAFSAMGAAFLANMNGKTTADLAHWGWLEYTVLIVSVLGSGILTLIAFLDQSIKAIRDKLGDTQLFFKEDNK